MAGANNLVAFFAIVLFEVCSGCQIKVDWIDNPLACSLGTFGKFIESDSHYSLSKANESGCESVIKNTVQKKKNIPSALLMTRGGCSFYTKAQYAHSLGFDLVIISDYSIDQGGSSNGLVPTIAEFGIDVSNITVIGISSVVSRILEQTLGTFSEVGEDAFMVSSSSDSNQYITRGEALLNSGFTILAAKSMETFLSVIQKSVGMKETSSSDSVSRVLNITSDNMKELLSLADRFSELGMELLASNMYEVSVMLDSTCAECSEKHAQALMKRGYIKEAVEMYRGMSEKGASDVAKVVGQGRVAALSFLLTATSSLPSVISAALEWRQAMETYRSIPMSDRHRHRTLQDGIVNSGGGGDSTLWLLFTLTDEVARSKWMDALEDAYGLMDASLDAFTTSGVGYCLRGIYEREEDDVYGNSMFASMECCDSDKNSYNQNTNQNKLEVLTDIHLTLSLFLDETGLFELSKR